jgi:large subunit ribosomal protein L7e
MNRRKRETERRTTIAIPSSAVKSTVGFAIRIHAGRHTSPEIKTELKNLGLKRKYHGIFVNLNQETVGKDHILLLTLSPAISPARLKPLDSYVAYGFLSSQLVHELIHRRAYLKNNDEVTHLSDNLLLENLFGHHNILCLNDYAHEIFTVGPAFAECVSALVPFRLSCPVGGYEKKILQIHDEVESKGGFLSDEELETFLKKIL